VLQQVAADEDVKAVLERGEVDPVWWVQYVLGFTPWEQQRKVLEALLTHQKVSVASCHSAGKSAVAACAALWWLYNHCPSVVVTTAPTDRQVRYILWKEIGVRHRDARVPLGGKCLTQELHLSKEWFALGFTSNDYDPDRFQGIHEEAILVIVDEACGISEEINEAIQSVLASGLSRELRIGNPTDPNTPFGASFKDPDVAKIRIDAYDTPNFTHFGITEEDVVANRWREKVTGELPWPMLLSPEYAYNLAKRLGVDHPIYRARVRGIFPEQSEDSLFPLRLLEKARAAEFEPGEPNVLACDVAREGSDESVIAHRKGKVVRILERRKKEDTMTTAGRCVFWQKVTGAREIRVDADGVGGGVADRLRELRDEGKFSAEVVDIHFGATPDELAEDSAVEFLNLRAQAYWGFYERLENGEVDLPDDDEVQDQFAMIRWKPTSAGSIQIIPKEKLPYSPDIADAVVIAYLRSIREPGDYGLTV
jgi:hypothetical protein